MSLLPKSVLPMSKPVSEYAIRTVGADGMPRILRWRRGAVLLLLLAVAACGAPAELNRPVVPGTQSAARLLPPGRTVPTSFPGANDAAGVVTADGGRLLALRFPTAQAARSGYDRLADGIARRSDIKSSSSAAVDETRYVKYSTGTVSGLTWLSGVWVFSVEAGTAEKVAALIAASGVGGLASGSSGGSISVFAWVMPVAIGLLGVFLGLFLPGWIIKRQVVAPVPGVPVLTRAELVDRLLALNDEKLPYIVREDPKADLIVEWKFADANWWGILAKQGVRKSYRLRLYFDEASHRASALDEFGEVDWSAGLTTAPTVHFRKTFFRGVVLGRRERGVAYGFKTPTGGGFGKMLDYEFDVGWLKDRVTGVISGSGWTYQPVLRAPKR
jgi:hypothetical protein